MVKRIVTVTEYVDDITGDAAVESINFGFGGALYEIDLNTVNAAALRQIFQPYVDAGRRVNRARSSPRKPTPGPDLIAVRAWARANGHEVADRGRIARSIVEEYYGSRSRRP